MSTALAPARPSSLEAETFVSAEHTHDLIAEVARLEREIKSARIRNAALLRALNGATPAVPAATFRGGSHTASLLLLAQAYEGTGRVPALRFTRDAAGRIVGIELAVLQTASDAAPVDGMAVYEDEDDDATGFVAKVSA